MRKTTLTKQALTGAVSFFAMMIAAGTAAAQAEEVVFDIEEQSLSKALLEFNEQSGLSVAAPIQLVEGKTAPAVKGEMSPEEALEKLLSNSGLKSKPTPSGDAFTVTLASASLGEGSTETRPFRVAQLDQEDDVRGIEARNGEDDESRQDVIVVTGTNIRGIAPDSSPTRSFNREDIQISGAATAQDFIQTLPFNFGGGSNSDISGGLPNDGSAGFNNSTFGTLGSSVNLRGLGSASTLVLLNGHRLAPSSGIGDFVDISLIPASALERVEILTDGASSIYGGDAVAGVVNFITRSDFEGVEASYRYGTVTQGDLDEHRASVTGGTNWDSGNALLVFEYFEQGNLSAADRSFSANVAMPQDLLPSQERYSILGSGSQEITNDIRIFADFTYSSREAELAGTTVTGSEIRANPTSENLTLAGGVEWEISDSWVADFQSLYSDMNSETNNTGMFPSARTTDSSLWSIDAKASGDLFLLPGGEVRVAFGGQYREESFKNTVVSSDTVDRDAKRDVYALYGEALIPIIGSENSLPGIDRLELNISGRLDDYSDFGSTFNPKVGVLWQPVDSLRLRGSYSTSFNPPPLGRVGAADNTVTVASTALTNLVFGLTPGDPSIADVVAITVAGTAENLDAETSRAFTGGFDFVHSLEKTEFSITTNYFDIEFDDRLGSVPIPGGGGLFDAFNVAFNNPELFPAGTVIFSPTADQISAAIANADLLNAFADPNAAEILNRAALTQNLAKTIVKGLDFDFGLTHEAESGVYAIGLNATYLVDFKQQATSATPLVEQVDTLFNPVDLKMRGRLGYSRGGFVANVFVNYTDSYAVDNTIGSPPIGSWTTVDASLSYNTQEKPGYSLLKKTIVRLSIRNLFNNDPPLTPNANSFQIFGFDPANASPLNRFVSFEITKAF